MRPKRTKRRQRRSGGAQSLSFNPGQYGQPIPRNYRTQFWCEADYKVPIATASLTSGAVNLNNPVFPFRPGGSSAFPAFTFLGPATESTLLPTGFSSLTSGDLYSTFKVLKSTFRLRWSGSNSGNNVIVTVVPCLNTLVPSDVYHARTFPFARQATFSVSKPNTGVGRDGYMTCSISPARLFGMSPVEGKADLSILATIGTSPAVQFVWAVFFQSNDLDVTATSASLLQVRVHYDVELESVTQMPVT